MKLELAITALLVLAVIPSAYCLGEGTPYIPTEEGVYYRVDVFDMEKWEFKPEDFWNLRNPDADILKAMNNPGVFIKTNLTIPTGTPPPGTFLHEWYDHNCNIYFTYNGSYYGLHRHVMGIIYGGWKNAGGSGLYCSVILLAEEPENPEEYTVLTNPDPYTLAAIEHPGTLILFDTDYLKDHPDEQCLRDVSNFTYQGKYYLGGPMRNVLAGWAPPRDWTKEIAAGIGISTVAVVAVAFIVYRKRKNQAPPGEH